MNNVGRIAAGIFVPVGALAPSNAAYTSLSDPPALFPQTVQMTHDGGPGTTFRDELEFGLDTKPQTGFSPTKVTFGNVGNSSSLDLVSIWQNDGAAGSGTGSEVAICGSGNWPVCTFHGASWLSTLQSGTYYAVVTGVISDMFRGSYVSSAPASPVRLPAAAWLLAVALVGLVAIARRKNASAPAAA